MFFIQRIKSILLPQAQTLSSFQKSSQSCSQSVCALLIRQPSVLLSLIWASQWLCISFLHFMLPHFTAVEGPQNFLKKC